MNRWLITIVFVNMIVISQCNSGWRHLYIIPGDNASKEQCPVEHCYSLQDVINNQSYFFDTYTVLELMPGMYDITESVGQLVIANISHFTLKGSLIQSKPNTTIYCQQNATFGFTFTNTVDVTILNIQIIHCCAQLTTNITIDNTKIEKFVTFKLDCFIKQWFGAYQGSCHEQNRFPCCISIASINNVRIVLSQTVVLHSKGVGILVLQYATLHVSNSLMAYSKINCIIYASNDLMNTSTTISDTKIMFGWGDSFNLASGLNLILRSISVRKQFDTVTLTNVTFANNIKSHGNLYLLIYRGPERKFVTINILINEISMTSKTATAGITIDYVIFDRYPSRFYWTKYNKQWTTCTKPGQNIKPVTVKIQRSYIE